MFQEGILKIPQNSVFLVPSEFIDKDIAANKNYF
jgi:hypothetical protein